MTEKLVVVIPAHNEDKTLPNILERQHFELKDHYEYRLMVIDDGSDDRTAYIALEKGAEVARHSVALGPGGALKTGFIMASEWNADYIVQIDSDGQHNPEDLKELLKTLKESGNDMVVGSRFLNGKPKMSSVRRLGINFFTWLTNMLTGYTLTDLTSGYRIFKAEHVNKIAFSAEKHWSIEMTLLAKKNGLTITEAPIQAIDRKEGCSQFFEIMTFLLYPFRAIKQIISVYNKGE